MLNMTSNFGHITFDSDGKVKVRIQFFNASIDVREGKNV